MIADLFFFNNGQIMLLFQLCQCYMWNWCSGYLERWVFYGRGCSKKSSMRASITPLQSALFHSVRQKVVQKVGATVNDGPQGNIYSFCQQYFQHWHASECQIPCAPQDWRTKNNASLLILIISFWKCHWQCRLWWSCCNGSVWWVVDGQFFKYQSENGTFFAAYKWWF